MIALVVLSLIGGAVLWSIEQACTKIRCPWCRSDIDRKALVCQRCGGVTHRGWKQQQQR